MLGGGCCVTYGKSLLEGFTGLTCAPPHTPTATPPGTPPPGTPPPATSPRVRVPPVLPPPEIASVFETCEREKNGRFRPSGPPGSTAPHPHVALTHPTVAQPGAAWYEPPWGAGTPQHGLSSNKKARVVAAVSRHLTLHFSAAVWAVIPAGVSPRCRLSSSDHAITPACRHTTRPARPWQAGSVPRTPARSTSGTPRRAQTTDRPRRHTAPASPCVCEDPRPLRNTPTDAQTRCSNKAAQTFSACHPETLPTVSTNSTAFKSHTAQPPDVPLLSGAQRLIGRRACCRRHAAGPMTTREVADLPSPSSWVSTSQILHCLGPGALAGAAAPADFAAALQRFPGAGCGRRLLVS